MAGRKKDIEEAQGSLLYYYLDKLQQGFI